MSNSLLPWKSQTPRQGPLAPGLRLPDPVQAIQQSGQLDDPLVLADEFQAEDFDELFQTIDPVFHGLDRWPVFH